jgi:predicted nucleotidyltransferase
MKDSPNLEDMRRAAEKITENLIVRFGARIEGVMIEGSVARGDIHRYSDIDLSVFINREELTENEVSQLPSAESLEIEGYNVDIGYGLFDDALEELEYLYGPDWEKQSSFLGDALILHDKSGRLTAAKRGNRSYSKDLRMKNVERLWDNMMDLDEAAGTAWELEKYRDVSVYSSMYGERCLRIIFPLLGKRIRVDKRLLEHGLSLIEDSKITDQIQVLLHSSSGGEYGSRQDAARRLNAIIDIKKWIRNNLEKMGIQNAIPSEAIEVTKPGDSLSL